MVVFVSPSVHVSALAVGVLQLTALLNPNTKAKTWKIQAFLIETMMPDRVQNVLWNGLIKWTRTRGRMPTTERCYLCWGRRVRPSALGSLLGFSVFFRNYPCDVSWTNLITAVSARSVSAAKVGAAVQARSVKSGSARPGTTLARVRPLSLAPSPDRQRQRRLGDQLLIGNQRAGESLRRNDFPRLEMWSSECQTCDLAELCRDIPEDQRAVRQNLLD